ncbi:hypothetical protein BDW59DRAFT_36907 [Aspergillus cavernicola]|uniref:Uncharacterized protein n=1 Tax=Aspergillus cavernicola TaxID=176166 RepID=A0ABR4HB31_9EURO
MNENRLEALYGELATVLIQLYSPSFPRIGSLNQVDDFTWEVSHRPLSLPMNDHLVGTLPQSGLPASDTTYDTASSYFKSRADLHVAHFKNHRNDSIHSADDARQRLESA